MKTITRRTALLGLGATAGWAGARYTAPQLPTLNGTQTTAPGPLEPAYLNDASRLSRTKIHKHIVLNNTPDTVVETLRTELAEARSEGRPVNIGAARHSMGGQAIPPGGTAVTLKGDTLETDSANARYRVAAGARWESVIARLDPAGWSPAVMQSNNDFGVAATFSVNAHGWPVPFGPMGSTVRSCRMVLPSGDLITCSAQENPDIFALAMGGYGLIGLIVDLDVDMVPNTRLAPTPALMPAISFADAFRAAIEDPEVTMAYGRLNVERARFFEDAVLTTFRETADQSDLPPAAGSGWMSHAARRIYRAQLGNEPAKRFRWWNETVLGPKIASAAFTRNSLINEPVATLASADPRRTDILHEYFVSFDRFNDFVSLCQKVIPASYQEFLNVTLRFVAQDDVSALSYASEPRIAAVMSFSQELTQRAEADMSRLTQALIGGVADLGGAYYLPYRPHATVEQFTRVYPKAPHFAAAKRALDPKGVLRNAFWDNYLETL